MSMRFLKKYKNSIVLASLCLFAFLLFSNTFNHQYGLDDFLVIENNLLVEKGFSGIAEIFTTNYFTFKGKGVDYRPIPKASFALEHQLFGENLFVFHFTNVLLFLLTIVLLYYFLMLLFPDFNVYLIGLICLLYVVHPLNSEVVCSLKNRDHLFSFIFVLTSAIFAFKYYSTGNFLYILLVAVSFLLGMMSKVATLPYLGIIPILLYIQTWKLNKKTLIVFATLTITTISYFLLVFVLVDGYSLEGRAVFTVENPIPHEGSIMNRISMILVACFFYIEKLLLPFNLSCYYGYDALGLLSFWSVKAVFALIAGIAIAVGFIYAFIKKSPFVVPALLFIANMAVASNIIAYVPGVVGDRIAFGGIVLSLAVSLVLLVKHQKFVKVEYLMILLFVLCLVFASQTFNRNKDWKDRITLYKADATTENNSAKIHVMYAEELLNEYINKGKSNSSLISKSKKHLKKSLSLLPSYPTANNLYGLILSRYENEPQKGMPYLKKALATNPSFEDAHFNLAASYHMLNDKTNAIKHYSETLKLNPNRSKAQENMQILKNQ